MRSCRPQENARLFKFKNADKAGQIIVTCVKCEGSTDILEAIKISEIKIPRAMLEAAKSRDLQTTIRIGKGGLSESVVNEVNDQLGSRPLVKIKLNRA